MTTTSPSASPIALSRASQPAGRLPGTLVVGGFATFLLTVLVLHVVQSDVDPRHNWVSDYANGRGGWLMAIAFLGCAVGIFGLALGTSRCVLPSRPRTVAVVGFGISSVMTACQALFASDPPRADGTTGYTTVGALHDLTGLIGGIAVVVGLFALARACRRDPAWERTARFVRLLAVLIVVGMITEVVIGEFSTMGTDGDGVAGLAQRIDLAVTMSGAILLGLRFLDSDRPADRDARARAALA